MSLIHKIRGKSQAQKIQIMIVVVILTAISLIALWVFTSKIGKATPKDTTLFRTLGRGLKDIKENFKK